MGLQQHFLLSCYQKCCHFFACGDQQPLSITAGFQFLTAIKCYWDWQWLANSATIMSTAHQNPATFTLLQNLVTLTAAICLCCCWSPELSYPLLFLTVDFGQLHQTLKSCHLLLTTVKSGWLLWSPCQPLINRIWPTTHQLSMSFPNMFLST
jgi:hypothetical protein